MAEDYYIFSRKGRKYLQVQFRDFRTGRLLPAVSSGATSELAAIRWAKAELKKRSIEAAGRPRPDIPLGTYAQPFFGEKCLYVKRRNEEGKTFSSDYIASYRHHRELYILPDPIAQLSRMAILRAESLWGPIGLLKS